MSKREMEMTVWDVDKLVPYEKNAKLHPQEQVKALARAIDRHGWDQHIVIEPDGTIIKGHGRRLAAIELGLVQVPVLVRHDLTKEGAQEVRISDNKIAAMGGIDEELLKADLAELFAHASDVTLEDMGFEEGEFDFALPGGDESDKALDELLGDPGAQNSSQDSAQSAPAGPPNAVDPSEYKSAYLVVVECNDEAEQEVVYEEMTEAGRKCRVLSM